MIATVLTLAALLAPVLAWNGSPAPNARERDQTIRLSKPGTRVPTPAVLSADRAAIHMAASAAGRLVSAGTLSTAAERRAAGPALHLSGRLGVTERVPQADGPRRAAPLAGSTFDTDGDGLPDTWERRYGLDPGNAADATADPDGDGLDNLTELRIRTTPNGADSDHNGIRDGDEDSDNDGAINLSEQQAGTDPGSGEDVPPAAETDANPGPAVVEGDTGTPLPASTDQSPDPAPTAATAPETAPAPAPPASDPAPVEAAPTAAAVPAPAAAPAPTPTGDGGGPGRGWGHADQGGHGTHSPD
ncbi:MAG: hypothetical protein ABI611_23400 [Solirubrobacteraceae bacterium]